MTLLEGPAAVVRGVTRHVLAEGVKFHPGDIIEVSEKGLAQIEFADGVALAMGAGTRMLALTATRGKPGSSDYYVTQGVLKLTGVKQEASLRFVTPVVTLQPAEGATVMLVRSEESSVFVESGEARVTESAAKGATPAVRLKGGEFYTRKAAQKAAVAARPSRDFIDALPKAFFDALPARIARFKEREVQPKRIDDVSYAEVETWLKAPPDIRRPLVQRFRPRVSDPAFRAALVANLKYHPEWDPILFPEKYKPKEPAAPARKSGSTP